MVVEQCSSLLAATAATKTEGPEESSGESEAEAWRNLDVEAGSMGLVPCEPLCDRWNRSAFTVITSSVDEVATRSRA